MKIKTLISLMVGASLVLTIAGCQPSNPDVVVEPGTNTVVHDKTSSPPNTVVVPGPSTHTETHTNTTTPPPDTTGTASTTTTTTGGGN